ncbi:thioredoxin domain-containing protein [Streptomyces sp. NPDC052040]|uniref:thioredoxin domain-containing protein n=1 Tax=unclassified Streptomyces TaxID=2593676 RepID=UPI0037D01865
MSKRNNHASKSAAREKLRQERERMARRDQVKRRLGVAGAIVTVLAMAGGIGYAAKQSQQSGHWAKIQNAKVVAPAHTTGENGTTVVVGKDTAKKTLKVYEDPRCPLCAHFEQVVGPAVQKDIDDGKFKFQYVGASFVDDYGNGEGSKSALSALGAALDVSQEAFLEYRAALYSEKWHPDETDDKFKDRAYLIRIADTVSPLKDNGKFRTAVKSGTYDPWALAMSKAFHSNEDQVTGTPSLVMDGRKLSSGSAGGPPMTVSAYNKAMDSALRS